MHHAKQQLLEQRIEQLSAAAKVDLLEKNEIRV
jgi:hypothetical protein